MKTLFAVAFAVVAALALAVSPVQAGSVGFEHRPSVFPKPVDHWAHWGKPAHGHFNYGLKHGHFHRPVFVVPRAVVVAPQVPVFVAPRRAWVPGFHAWTGHYWVWVPGHWR
ncbi:MAG: hypothetical protein ACREK6_06955 [Candidatus Rokuibacteriota bacterium]